MSTLDTARPPAGAACQPRTSAPSPTPSPASPTLSLSRYPERNELTGGFAGGELGLQYFKEKVRE